MAISVRAKWMAQLISESFTSLDKYRQADDFCKEDNKPIIDKFLSGTGPAAVFIYEVDQLITAQAFQKVLKVSYGGNIKE
jgi:hypothetical protein